MATSRNKYQRIYLSSLAAIVLLVVASQLVFDHIVSEESSMTEVNDIGSRQSMLSERIVHLLLEYANEQNPEKRQNIVARIRQSMDSFNQTHKLLIRGLLSNGENVIFEDNIDDLFFGQPEYLDEKARLFIYNTREVLSKDWHPELISSFYLKELRKTSEQTLHDGLDDLATFYTMNSKSRINRLRLVIAILLSTVIILVISIGVFVFKPLFKRITEQQDDLEKLAYIDPLTNCHNRRSFIINANTEYERSRRNQLPYSVLFLDIDYLKTINDSFGHAVGDAVIKEITRYCKIKIRDIDIIGRIGGDEFGILLPECDLTRAKQTAERLRQGMSEHSIPGISGEFQVSTSIGVASIMPSDKNAFDTISRADENLYEAKRKGRNLIIAA